MDPTPQPSRTWPPRPLPLPLSNTAAAFVLRPWVLDDAARLSSAWTDATIRRWTNPSGTTVEGARQWIAGCDNRRAQGLALDLVIDVDGEVAGEIGLSSFEARRRAALVGYWIAKNHRGGGLAAKALGAVTSWFHAELGGGALLAQCDQENLASQVTAQRAGFTKLGLQGNDVVYVSRSVPMAGQ